MPCSTPADPAVERGRVAARLGTLAARFAADQLHPGVGDEGVEDADGVGAAADAGDHGVRQPAGLGQHCSRASTPMTRWKSRTIIGNGCGPPTEPMQ